MSGTANIDWDKPPKYDENKTYSPRIDCRHYYVQTSLEWSRCRWCGAFLSNSRVGVTKNENIWDSVKINLQK